MGITYGNMHYNYEININLSSFFEAIMEKIDGADEYELDGDTLRIYGSSTNRAKQYYSPATRWEPEEQDEEFTEDTVEDLNLEQIVVDACNNFKDYLVKGDKSISSFEFDDDSFEFEADEDWGPNLDEAYDSWKDRQLMGDDCSLIPTDKPVGLSNNPE